MRNLAGSFGRGKRVSLALAAALAVVSARMAEPDVRIRESHRQGHVSQQRASGPQARDRLVLLFYPELHRYRLSEVTVDPRGKLSFGPSVSLPDGPSYTGPVMASRDECAVLASAEGPEQETRLYRWRLGENRVRPSGPTMRLSPDPWGAGLLGLNTRSGTVLLSPRAPEALADSPVLWKPGEERWRKLAEAYPRLGKEVDRAAHAACFSPDGSRLCLAVNAGAGSRRDRLLIYDISRKRVLRFRGPQEYVWTLTFSSDNRKVAWIESGYPRELMASETGRRVRLDRYSNTAFGLLDLATGRSRYWRLSTLKVEPADALSKQPLIDQADARLAFSKDQRRLYLPLHGLACLDLDSGRLRVFDARSTVGFAVAP